MKFFVVFFLFVSCLHSDLTPHLKKITDKKGESAPVKNIDFIYLINLEERPERLEACLNQLSPYEITPHRFPAICGWNLPPATLNEVGVQFQQGMESSRWIAHFLADGQIEKGFLKESSYGKTVFHPSMTPGTIGCALSHLSILQDAYDAGYETIWVMEDDISVEKDPRELSLLIDKLDLFVGDKNWDVLYTDFDASDRSSYAAINDFETDLKGELHWFWRPDRDLTDRTRFARRDIISKDFIKIGSRMHTHSLILRRSGIKKILDFEKKYHLFLPYDHEIATVPGIQLYSVRYNVVSFAPFPSDTRTNMGRALSLDRAITYGLSGGRLGDNLLSYLRAKWISYQYDIPLLYHPFPYSDELSLGLLEAPMTQGLDASLKKVLFSEEKIKNSSEKQVLYISRYFSECAFERKKTKERFPFQVDWKDPGFRKVIKPLLAPRKELQLILPPKDRIGIAIHFREGGSFDARNKGASIPAFAVKFPPFEFYIEGLLKTIELFKGKLLYCYLFTDAADPKIFLEKLKGRVPKDTQIVFDCRKSGNADNKNVLEDFFSLFHFDVLIHPQSNFSLLPSLIHDYAVVYAPLSARFLGASMVIDEVKFEINEDRMRALQ